MNRIYAVHVNGRLIAHSNGNRKGMIYTTESPAKRMVTKLKARHPDRSYEVVAYCPESLFNVTLAA